MTRIFEALRKSQARAGALPFPPAEPASLRPAPVARPVTPAPPAESIMAPRIETRPTVPLPDDIVREMTALRIGLESAIETQKSRIVMFMGSMNGEGVTTVATQFASTLASDGRGRVLLLDAQGADHPPAPAGPVPVRAAGAGRGMSAAPGAPGLPGARGGPPLSVARLHEEIRRAGGRTPSVVRTFLGAVSAQFDWVVVDGAPVLESPESVDLAPLVDGVVLVVRSGHTKRPVIVRAVELLRKSGARVLGTVLNRRRLEIPDFIYRRV